MVYYLVSGAYTGLNIYGVINQFIEGPYHFWYLFSLVGLYILTPILRKITADEDMTVYYLVIFSVLNIIFEYLVYLPKVGEIIREFTNKLGVNIVGYVGYYILGYYLYSKKEQIGKKPEIFIYGLGIFCFVLTIFLKGRISPDLRSSDFVKQYLKPNVIIYSSSLYLFFIKRISNISFPDMVRQIFAKLTELSFGVYILHALINEFFSYIPLAYPAKHPYIMLFLLTAAIYLTSLALTWLIRKIPVVGKKIT